MLLYTKNKTNKSGSFLMCDITTFPGSLCFRRRNFFVILALNFLFFLRWKCVTSIIVYETAELYFSTNLVGIWIAMKKKKLKHSI